MIPRFLVPHGAKPPAADEPSSRRRPTTMDERTLVPAMLPIVVLNGQSTIPSSLPLDSIAQRVVVPRDIKRDDFVPEETGGLPPQPTEMDERLIVPLGAAPPEISKPVPFALVDPLDRDVFTTGEVNFLAEAPTEGKIKWEAITRISSIALHILVILAIIFAPKIFPSTGPSPEQIALMDRQSRVLLPPGNFEPSPPRPKQPPVHVNPKTLNDVAPKMPEPAPTPPPREPEHIVRELPAAPVPKANPAQPAPTVVAPQPKSETPKLEAPQEQTPHPALVLPNASAGQSIQDSIRDSAKMNAPAAVRGGGQVPNKGLQGAGRSQAKAFGNVEILNPKPGVDYNDYLHRVYVVVYRNWIAVMPESAQLGDQGIVSLEFDISKNGSVPAGQPVRIRASGKEPLDRAAISSILTSNPFEPLPAVFGDSIRLRYTYFYNLSVDTPY